MAKGAFFHDAGALTVTLPMTFKKHGGRKLVIAPNGADAWALPRARIDNTMVKALARAPENTVALFVLFEACTQLGDDGGAHAARQRLEQLGNSSTRMADAFFFRGVSHLASRRFERSCDNFRLAVSLKPDHEWAIINLGVVLTRMDRPQEAIAILTEHTITEPNRAAVWVGLGNALLTAGNAKTAVACYTRALELEANDPAVLANRAIAKEKTGDMAGAQEDRRRAAGITE